LGTKHSSSAAWQLPSVATHAHPSTTDPESTNYSLISKAPTGQQHRNYCLLKTFYYLTTLYLKKWNQNQHAYLIPQTNVCTYHTNAAGKRCVSITLSRGWTQSLQLRFNQHKQ
jgi:hypothetical protein